MNYLAHLALAGSTDASLVGNLLGDFAKGTQEHLLKTLPSELVAGLMMHRSIDRYTDSHPCFKEARELMNPARRRFAGIVIDIFFDHFLSLHWDTFHTSPLDPFIEHCYQTLENHPEWRVGDFEVAFPYMREQNWLECYRHKDGIQLTLQRVSRHGKYTTPIADCYDDFITHYAALESIFLRFYPDLQAYAKKLLVRT